MRSRPQLLPPSKFITGGQPVTVEDSLIASGCIIEGTVTRSILSPGVRVGAEAVVEDAILWDGVVIGPRAKVRRAIIEDGVRVPAGFSIGYDPNGARPASTSPKTDCGGAQQRRLEA
jgi:glucose-1-phosphate adenylyltransferase